VLFSQLYDLFAWDELIIETVSMAPTSTPGGFMGFCDADVLDEQLIFETGSNVIQAGVAAPNNQIWSAFASSQVGINFPQQACYYTANTDNPNLMVAGLFHEESIGAVAASFPFHLVWLHYKARFFQSSGDRALQTIPPLIINQGITISFVGVALQIRGNFATPLVNFSGGLPLIGYVYRGTIVTVNNGPNAATWCKVLVGPAQTTLQLAVLNTVYWRLSSLDANTAIFYADLGQAMAGISQAAGNGEVLLAATTLTPATTCNFVLDYIQGFPLTTA